MGKKRKYNPINNLLRCINLKPKKRKTVVERASKRCNQGFRVSVSLDSDSCNLKETEMQTTSRDY